MKLYNLFNPFAYRRKILSLLEARRIKKAYDIYDVDEQVQESRAIYSRLGLNFDNAVALREKTISQVQCLHDLDLQASCISEHWTLFAALAHKPISRVLELGTYNAETTHYLANLYPSAEIVTLDLPDDSPVFMESYGRENTDYRKTFIERRTGLLDLENITFLQTNSFLLPALGLKSFDLIWVDACHEYPDVAWDVCNAYHLLNKDGWLLCDDIYKQKKLADGLTNASYDVLKTLEKHELCTISYILKRFTPEHSADPKIRKHCAIVRKIACT